MARKFRGSCKWIDLGSFPPAVLVHFLHGGWSGGAEEAGGGLPKILHPLQILHCRILLPGGWSGGAEEAGGGLAKILHPLQILHCGILLPGGWSRGAEEAGCGLAKILHPDPLC